MMPPRSPISSKPTTLQVEGGAQASSCSRRPAAKDAPIIAPSTTRHEFGREALFGKRTQDPDVRPPARRAAAQCHAESRALGHRLGIEVALLREVVKAQKLVRDRYWQRSFSVDI
jgi:hypothetical protein